MLKTLFKHAYKGKNFGKKQWIIIMSLKDINIAQKKKKREAWNILRTLLLSKSSLTHPQTIIINDIFYHDLSDIAKNFNYHFINIRKKYWELKSY